MLKMANDDTQISGNFPVFQRQLHVRHSWRGQAATFAVFLGALAGFSRTCAAGQDFHAGPLFDQFQLTLDSGRRTEAAGPLFYDQQKESETTWALPPLFSHDTDPTVESREDDFLYPLLTYERHGTEYRWQFCQVLSIASGQDAEGFEQKRFTLYPVFFEQRSPETNENYTALVPFYGHIKHRLYRDDIFFVMFPFYSQTRKQDVVSDNYLYPFFNLSHGDGMRGWQFWPVVGRSYKDVTTQTNDFGEKEIVGGYDKFFALWPVHFYQNTGIGTDDPAKFRADLPFYSLFRSPQRDSTSVLWPFFNWIDDREKKYREWEMPYPFIVVARGEGKTTTRVFPFFSRAHNDTLEDDFYLWPLYKYNRLHTGALDRQWTRILFFLFADVTEKNTETRAVRKRIDLWPLFTWHRDFNGDSWLQILAPIEPVLPNNRGVERNWSPLWSLWRSENNPKTGTRSQSFLWNLYRHDVTPTAKKCSFLFGLFQSQSGTEGRRVRLFYIPIVNTQGKTK
jgi:hypothetical protein